MSSIDDTNEVIALEAMNGLSKVFKIVEESRISPILVNICHRIKPAFDKVFFFYFVFKIKFSFINFF